MAGQPKSSVTLTAQYLCVDVQPESNAPATSKYAYFTALRITDYDKKFVISPPGLRSGDFLVKACIENAREQVSHIGRRSAATLHILKD